MMGLTKMLNNLKSVFAALCCASLIASSLVSADTDVQHNNKQGREMTPLMPELSCAKNARRIKKLDNKIKRRRFIKKCQAERDLKLKAEQAKLEQAQQEKKQADDKVFEEFLKKGKKRADAKVGNEK